MPTLLELRNVSKTYTRGWLKGASKPSLQSFSLSIDENEPKIIAVVGESGSGKSTLGHILLGLQNPTSGSVVYRGQELRAARRSTLKTFRREVQAVTQDPFSAYNPFYKVDHALIVPIRKFNLAARGEPTIRLMQQACVGVGLNPDDTLGRYPHQMSGGQRQRLMVARALVMRPKLLIADEPVSMVDASLRATILNNVASLRRDHGVSVVYITHDITTAYHIADTVFVLHKGVVVESGDAGNIIENPQHPYTRLLINSIPWPDLDRSWGEGQNIQGAMADMRIERGL